jgi:hypothetical protein
MKSTFETAVLLAQRTGAYVEGVPLWFGVPEFVVAEMASTFSIETYRARRDEETVGARKLRRSNARTTPVVCNPADVVSGWLV